MQEALEKLEAHPSTVRRASLRRIALGLLAAGIVLAGAWGWWSLRQISQPVLDLPPQSAALPLPAGPEAAITASMEREITAPVANALAQVTTRLAALETEFEQLKSAAAVPANPADAGAISQLDGAVRTISGSLDAIHTAMTALNARLAALEAIQAAQPLGGEAKRISYALGLRELERALNGSGPFAVELESLDKLLDAAQPDPSIAQLRTRATTGIPTRAILLARFDAAAAAIVRADAASDVAPGWAGRTYAFVMSLVMIRPLGEREGLDAPSRVARAQMRLEEGDLDAAVKELGELEDAAAKAAAPWLTDARARLAAEQALAQLSATLTQRLNEAATSTPVTPVENAGE